MGGFKPSRAGSEAFGDIGSKNAEMAADLSASALSDIGAIERSRIQADAQVEAAERAGMWSALGGIAGSAITGGFSMVPKTLKVV